MHIGRCFRLLCQDKAKIWADANIVKLVFVINDTETETQLSKNSGAWSRLATPVVVEDLHQDEAVSFLKAAYFREQDRRAAGATGDVTNPATGKTMDDGLARRIVDLVGGRVLQLIAMKRDWLYGVSFDDSAQELKNREREQLMQVKKKYRFFPPLTFLVQSEWRLCASDLVRILFMQHCCVNGKLSFCTMKLYS